MGRCGGVIAEAQVSLRDCAFGHLFGKEGFVDASPQLPEETKRRLSNGSAHVIEDAPPLLERTRSEIAAPSDELFAALEAATVRLLNAA